MSRTALFLIVLLIWSASSSHARASGPTSLELVVAPCLRSIEDDLRAIVAIELATTARIDDETRDATLRATITCRGDAVRIEVLRVDTGEVREERVAMPSRNTPPAARTIALLLSELVAVLWPIEPEPPVPLPPAPITDPLRLDAVLDLRFGAADGPWMSGARVGVQHALRESLRLTSGVEWLMGARGTSLGRVGASSLTIDAAPGFGLRHGRDDRSWVGLDVGLRFGAMFWRGHANEGDVTAGRVVKPTLGAFGRAVYEPALTPRLSLRLALELAVVLVGSTATAIDMSGGAPTVVGTVALDRFWCTLGVGVSLAL